MKRDAAWQVQPEHDQFPAGPSDVRDDPPGRCPNQLRVLGRVVGDGEAVSGPGEWSRFAEAADVGDLDAHVDVASALAARGADVGDARDRGLEDRADVVAIEAGAGIERQIDAAQRHQRGNRGIHVHRGRAVEVDVGFFLVFVPPGERIDTARRQQEQGGHRQAGPARRATDSHRNERSQRAIIPCSARSPAFLTAAAGDTLGLFHGRTHSLPDRRQQPDVPRVSRAFAA